MFYKGIIFDLDNTIYDYDFCHNKAITEVYQFLIKKDNSLNIEKLKSLYDKISRNLKKEICNTASSHNKSIYFKQLLEKIKMDLSLFSKINNMYWEIFYNNMFCFEGVKDFIIWNKSIGKKIGILTDYETEYQIIKLEKLEILQYIDVIVTSEEVGIEKPSKKMFSTILNILCLNSSDVIIIGDNYEKDILGARKMDIISYWFHKNNLEFNSFTSFTDLNLKFMNIYNELEKFKKISKYCGERFDLVQAGGGNTSVKIDEFMFIKASGFRLTSIDENNGYVMVNNTILLEDIEQNSVKNVTEYNFIGITRGSIETYMHSILKTYTIHLHPIQINRVLISKNAKEIINNIYPNSLIIDYITPGINVCNKIKELYNDEKIIFLLNHGIIITSDNFDEVYYLLDDVLEKFESYQNIDFIKYKNTNKISNLINNLFNTNNVSYLCEDSMINKFLIKNKELFKEKITFPDVLIYCGVEILLNLNNIEDYKNKYNESPKIIIYTNNVYINSHSINKCKEIEEVLKSNLIILDSNFEKIYLELEEICFLNNWDAEKYRKLL
jgi:HAD superfamily hydrolase (TIGR01549 family)